MKTVSYTSAQLLSCAKCNGDIIICVDESLTDTHLPWVVGTVVSTMEQWDICGKPSYLYGFQYDENDLADPSYSLVPSDVTGVFCKGCLTDYIDSFGMPPMAYILSLLAPYFDHICLVTSEAELIAAIANVDCNHIVIGESFVLTANRTIQAAKSVTYLNGCETTTNGHVLTINGPFISGAYQCFVTTAGDVKFDSGSVDKIYPEWFGAVGDALTDDTDAFQAALEAGIIGVDSACIWVEPLSFKTYMISKLVLPRKTKLGSMQVSGGSPTLKSNAATALLECNPVPDPSHFGEIFGLRLDGSNTAAACVDTNGCAEVKIHDCIVISCAVGILSDEGTWNKYSENYFGNVEVAIKLVGYNNSIIIAGNTFRTMTLYSIEVPVTANTHRIWITNNTFSGVPEYNIHFQTAAGAGYTLSVIRDNHFESHVKHAHIYIGEDVAVNITGNAIGETLDNFIECDGFGCDIRGNEFHDGNLTPAGRKAVALLANSEQCIIGPNLLRENTGNVPDYSDAGTNNIIERQPRWGAMGATADRPGAVGGASEFPALTGTAETGLMYLDTGLDADGKPIWWNGAAWVDATGAVV